MAAGGPAPVWLEAVNGAQHRLGHLIILTVGRMSTAEQYKGQDTLLRAFPAIRQRFSEAQLVLIGSGDDLPRLLALARSLPEAAQQAVFMPGLVNDGTLDALYRQSFVFAMPSTGEGFGLVYLEAMSRGKPCVGGKLDATPGVVQDGITGALVDDPKSGEQLAAAIMGLMADPERARQMGQAGYRRVQSTYLFTHFQKRFWEALGVSP